MLALEQGNYYGLGAVGSRIWSLIEEPVLVGDLVKSLLQGFEVDRKICCNHTSEFLEQLRTHRLIECL